MSETERARLDRKETIALLWMLLATQIESALWVIPAALGAMTMLTACAEAYRANGGKP